MSSTSIRESAPRKRPRWFDARLAIGLGLVLASIAGVVAVIGAADKTVPVLAARSSFSAGDVIDAGDLIEQRVGLGTLVEHYLSPDDVPKGGVVVTRTVTEGELVPAAAIGSASSVRSTLVVVTIAGQLPSSIVHGSIVDLWSLTTAPDSDVPPSVVAPDVTVVRVIEDEGLIAGAGTVELELLVPRSSVSTILKARVAGDALSVVPASVPLEG